VQSRDAVKTEVPSPENVAVFTKSPWPAKVWIQAPLAMLQSLAVWSSDAVNTEVPSLENRTEDTSSPYFSDEGAKNVILYGISTPHGL
jgi:hypothetical protein